MHAISPEVMESLMEAVELAETEYQGMVIWSGDAPFSVGADLEATMPAFVVGGADAIDSIEGELQNLMMRLRYAQVPVVGCHPRHGPGRRLRAGGVQRPPRGAHGKLHRPGGSGRGPDPRCGRPDLHRPPRGRKMQQSTSKDLLPFLTEGFTAAAMAKVGTSAIESRKLGYLLDSDIIVPHKDEVLFTAINEAKALAASGWRAPVKRLFPVAGRSGIATIQAQLVNMRDGGLISAYDFKIARMIAEVVCGGEVDGGTLVTEEYLLALERKAFCHLIGQPKTHERIFGHAQHRQAGAQLMRQREKSL